MFSILVDTVMSLRVSVVSFGTTTVVSPSTGALSTLAMISLSGVKRILRLLLMPMPMPTPSVLEPTSSFGVITMTVPRFGHWIV